MKTGDQITLGMLSDFKFNQETTLKFQAWAALDALDEGMSEDDVLLIFGLSVAQLHPFIMSWQRECSLMYS
ncbi:hypothetical protein MUN82_10070 [Hymenobacter aerilatus]|uniref:Uncharacterized protein n=1 Tax=Hymenobacter aerilatus TaxID=2932251 RepID=A0A8T9SZX3_9BACT|nr:hypothetical protein [Hymenobacter aerilatus]UOR07425.1 hypothetical protein MUN82_10070 [Hymenobacter aerilatus]